MEVPLDSRRIVGIGLKMYLDHDQTLLWLREMKDVVDIHPATVAGDAAVFVLPSFPSLPGAVAILSDSGVLVGAQDLAEDASGAFTGEVSGRQLSQVGCALVEVGHAERRTLFGESEEVVSRKLAAAFRSGLIPVLCIGEASRVSAEHAIRLCIAQLRSALEDSLESSVAASLVVAYEPRWAIGATEPAPREHIAEVVGAIRRALAEVPELAGSKVIYGGSAGVGLLTVLDDVVDGVFLGRSAHDPEVVSTILDEITALAVAKR